LIEVHTPGCDVVALWSGIVDAIEANGGQVEREPISISAVAPKLMTLPKVLLIGWLGTLLWTLADVCSRILN